MKKALLFLLLFPISIFAQQREVFRIDSLLKTGILLNQGWKWHAGDNPDWAKPGFDDAGWAEIDPTKDIFDLPKVSKKGDVFWLRLPVLITDSTLKEALIMTIQQSGASELYLNGKLIQRIGVFSADKSQIKAFSSGREPLNLQIQTNQLQTLAVRYALQPNVFYGTHFARLNSLFQLEIGSLKTWYNKENKAQFETYWNNVLGTLLITLCILFFAFYLFFPKQKVNLYFAIYSALMAIPIELFNGFYTIKYTENYYWVSNAIIIMGVVGYSFLLLAIYRLFTQKTGIAFWLIILLGIICVPMAFLVYKWGWVIYGILFNLSVNLELLRIAMVGVLNNKKGAWFIASGGFIFCTSWLLFLYAVNTGSSFEYITPYLYALAQISIPLSVALNLGYNIAQTNHSLQQKFTEVEILSYEKQQLLATQNETLERQVVERTSELRASQAQLIQSEKLASLGELTAGIAHEIQNPLNFVNNFAEVSEEMLGEMEEELDKGDTAEVKAIAADLKQNLSKINHHGKRASSIVKGMLEHSRASTGVKEPTDLNALADEYLRLAYHGLRAKDSSFNATMETHFDPDLPHLEVVPQDIGRVILNLINNAFYAVAERSRSTVTEKAKQGIEGYHPTVTVSSNIVGDKVEISVKDNGNGIPHAIKDKIFQPFFTTKPTGQGTGLGLSLAYDIVTKGHGGNLAVESTPGSGTSFVIQFPINEANL
jgi:signal transduction histidine kinase